MAAGVLELFSTKTYSRNRLEDGERQVLLGRYQAPENEVIVAVTNKVETLVMVGERVSPRFNLWIESGTIDLERVRFLERESLGVMNKGWVYHLKDGQAFRLIVSAIDGNGPGEPDEVYVRHGDVKQPKDMESWMMVMGRSWRSGQSIHG